MINYTCDLCGSECDHRTFALPMAATFVNGELCDGIPIAMNLCKECKNVIYKTIETRTTQEKLKHFNKLALNIKMRKHLEE